MSIESAEAPTDALKPTSRRRLGLSVRALMLVVLVLGGWLGWIAHRARVQREAVAVIRRHHASVWFNQSWHRNPFPPDPQPGPPLLRRWVGPDYFDTALSVNFYGGRTPQKTMGDDVMRAACQLAWLEHLSIVGCDATDAGAEGLGGLTRLRSLDVRFNPRMTARAVKDIGRLTELEFLGLGAIPLRDEDMGFLRRLTKLQTLALMGREMRLTDAVLDEVAALPELTAVQCFDLPITADGFRRLRGLRNLKVLSLHGAQVDRLDDLRFFPNLNRVDLNSNPIDDDDLAVLKSLPKLSALDLRKTRITDRGVAILATFPSISELDLGGTAITDAALVDLARLPGLVSLDVKGTKMTAGALTAFKAAHPLMDFYR